MTNNLVALRLYSDSGVNVAKHCMRQHYYSHVRKWLPVGKALPLIFGSGWHAAMDVIWKNAKAKRPEHDAIVKEAYAAFVETWVEMGMAHPDELGPDELDEMSPRTPQIALEMLYNYIDSRQYIFQDPSFKLIAIEEPFAVPLDPEDPTLFYVGRLDKVFEYRGKVLVGEHKCLGAGTPVLRYDGSVVPVESVREGDLLMGPDSRPRKVTSACTGIQELYRVTPIKGDPYVVNKAHILSLKMTPTRYKFRCGKKSYGAFETANVSVTDYLETSQGFRSNAKGWRARIDFEEKETHLHLPPYMLGVWLGDGNSANQGVTAIEPEIVQAIKEYAASRSLYIRTTGKANSQTHFVTDGSPRNPLMDALRSFNLIHNKHIPFSYKAGDEKTRFEVLAGIIDTDGNAQHNGYRITQKNKTLAEDICYLARSLGFAAYMPKRSGTCTNNGKIGEYYYIYISGNCSVIPVRVPRKRVKERTQPKNVLVTGIDVEPIGPGRYYGFELEGPDHLFLLGDFTVTHNTTSMYRKDKHQPFRSDFLDSFSPNSQVDGYLFKLYMEYGEKAGGVWIDAALVHKTVHDGFTFIPVDRQFSQVDAWLWTIRTWIDDIERNRAVLAERSKLDTPYLAAFPQNTTACIQYGRACSYADLCRGVANPAKLTTIPMGFQLSSWSLFDEIQLEKLGFKKDNTGEEV